MKLKNLIVVGILLINILGCSNATKKSVIEPDLSFNMNENFENKNGNWIEENNKYAELKIENGIYNFENKLDNRSYSVWNDVQFRDGKLYMAKAKMRHDNGMENSGFGIFIGFPNEHFITIEINNNGEIIAYYEDEKNFEPYFEWTKSDFLKADDWNEFMFIKEGKNVEFSINNFSVLSFSLKEDNINRIGFKVNNLLKVNIDDIQCKEIESTF